MFNVLSVPPFSKEIPEPQEPSAEQGYCSESYAVTSAGLLRLIRTPWLSARNLDAPIVQFPLPFGGGDWNDLARPNAHLDFDFGVMLQEIRSFLEFATEKAPMECQADIVLVDNVPTLYKPYTCDGSDLTVSHQDPDVNRGHWLLDIHSHPDKPYFSSTDNNDDAPMIKISMCVGRLRYKPSYVARICLGRGFFIPLDFEKTGIPISSIGLEFES